MHEQFVAPLAASADSYTDTEVTNQAIGATSEAANPANVPQSSVDDNDLGMGRKGSNFQLRPVLSSGPTAA
ncbi:hypothetical protein DIJ64_09565 [Mycobacterium leprae]|uniref:Uncharacterized protein n=1 Tax=Mycobacterium leprae TaxID=1769 RepID=A0AAD2JDQ0_MYCLR|nr:hypothetical protein [Mycobacterium leprae]AWV48212.1 hypothetical protein DIJ64_09565 [Mycobacterium leprae]OAR20849.1 hypothetical protein A8144_09225 [Mycobacterium leprae 3125609]OAX70960.1 hypothetical protein A3216_08705 [Mycobacterium leprae 7935681]